MSFFNRLVRVRTYFLRGNNFYIGLLYSFLSNLVVIYYLLIKHLTHFPRVHFFSFALIFGAVYVVICVTLGYLDYRKTGFFQTEAVLLSQSNPMFMQLFERMERIEKLLEKDASR